MPPAMKETTTITDRFELIEVPLVDIASVELEKLRRTESRFAEGHGQIHAFPPACSALLRNIAGNQYCVDCGGEDPEWAAVSYGALVCLRCSGRHRSLGVQVSCVRSVKMDDWSVDQILLMLEGGNMQLSSFFERHGLVAEAMPADDKSRRLHKGNVVTMRYKTKAALFYRQQLEMHAARIREKGPYRGRAVSRGRTFTKRNSCGV